MPDFEIVSLEEAQFRTIPGRQGRFINQYIGYIQQLAPGQAGKLRLSENENLQPYDGDLFQRPKPSAPSW
jgi:hypothetical protein